MTDGAPQDGDEVRRDREREPDAWGVSLESQSDWVLLFGFTAVMTIPFALVAWLMS
jgi:hypothetical protein